MMSFVRRYNLRSLLAVFIVLILCSGTVFAQSFSWAKALVGPGGKITYGLDVDDAGNTLLCGAFYDSVDFDPGSGVFWMVPEGPHDLFACKLDANGDLVWAKRFGGPGFGTAVSIAEADGGSIYMTGRFVGMIDFDPGAGLSNEVATGGGNPYVLKMTAQGDLDWVRTLETQGGGGGNVALPSDSGGIWVGGRFSDTTDFDPGIGTQLLWTNTGAIDGFLLKLDGSGNFESVLQFECDSQALVKDVVEDEWGQMYVMGLYRGRVDLDPGAGKEYRDSEDEYDAFLVKLKATGEYIWGGSIGGSYHDEIQNISLDGAGGLILAGGFVSNCDVDPGAGVTMLNCPANQCGFVSRLDTSGQLVWARPLQGDGASNLLRAAVDDLGNSYLTGYFRDSVDFDPGPGIHNLVAQEGDDIFVWKLNSMGDFGWAVSFGGMGNDYGIQIGLDGSGNVYTSGTFVGSVDFDPGSGVFQLGSSQSVSEIFVQKMGQTFTNVRHPEAFDFAAFPNPSTGRVMIECEDVRGGMLVEVLDMSGRVLHSGYQRDKRAEVKLPESHGMYFVRVTGKAGSAVRKVIRL